VLSVCDRLREVAYTGRREGNLEIRRVLCRKKLAIFGRGALWTTENFATQTRRQTVLIRELQGAKDQIETTDEIPQGLKQKLCAIRPKFEPLWPAFEGTAQVSGNSVEHFGCSVLRTLKLPS
jgi:hypothetical protein